MQEKQKDIIIIGGGLTGLTLAFYLKKAGKDFLIVEQQDRTGGVINTISEEGFIYETGPNTGVLSSTEIVELFDSLNNDCKLVIANPESKKRYIWKNKRWNALPSGFISAVTTPLFSFYDKIRILGEPFRKAGLNPDESIASLVKRRMGQSYLDYAVDPFISGIYAGDPHRLITRYAMPKLYRLEQDYGSFIGGAIEKKKLPKSALQKRTTSEVFSVNGGLTYLISALNNAIGNENIITACKNVKVDKSQNGFLVSFNNEAGQIVKLNAPKVITTTGANILSELLPFISKELIQPLSVLKYAPVVQVAVGFTNWKGLKLDAFGALMPTKENRNMLGVLFPSAIFDGRAPKNGALLSVFLGGVKNASLINKSDEEIKLLVLNEISETLGENAAPDLLRIFRYSQAIPQYDISSEQRIFTINKIQDENPGLFLAGNIRDGIGMSDRVKQARMLAEQLNN